MKRMTERQAYRDRMIMDGARVYNLNPASAVDLVVGKTIGPVAAKVGKIAGTTVAATVIAVSPLAATGCPQETKPTPTPAPTCECPNGADHWEGEDCCTNNDGSKTTDCNCNPVAKASGDHITGTIRYTGEHGDCYVTFNGESVIRSGDNCDRRNEPRPDVAKTQSESRTLAHGVGSVTVTGFMTDAQWDGVADKVAGNIGAKIGEQIDEYGSTVVDNYKLVFDRGITYIVEPNPVGYNDHKTTGDGKTAYIALNKVDSAWVLLTALAQNRASVDGMAVSKAGKSQGKVQLAYADVVNAQNNIKRSVIQKQNGIMI